MDAAPTAATEISRDNDEAKTEDDEEHRIHWVVSQDNLTNIRHTSEDEECGKQQIQDSHRTPKPILASIPTKPFGDGVSQNGQKHENAAKEFERIVGGCNRNDARDEEKCCDSEVDCEQQSVHKAVGFRMVFHFKVLRRKAGLGCMVDIFRRITWAASKRGIRGKATLNAND
ncbi:hypothetical protein [Crateriforma spongiae]|uniref:hypothetical protein n=1 Tax=Crateriforma spongiae TaxID=2724528 RepID=UPI0039B0421A